MKAKRVPLVSHPGFFVKEEMEARGWTVDDLASASELTATGVRELIAGRINITPIFAMCLAKGFGTSKSFWVKLQLQWNERGKNDQPNHAEND